MKSIDLMEISEYNPEITGKSGVKYVFAIEEFLQTP